MGVRPESTRLAGMAFVVAIGTVLGLAVTIPPLAGMVAGLAEETGTPVALHLHWPTVVWVTLACLALAVGVALTSTLARLRRPTA